MNITWSFKVLRFLFLACSLWASIVAANAQRMYWVETNTNSILSANLDGSDIQTELVDADGPFRISVDLPGGFAFYLTQSGQGMAYRSDINNFSSRTLIYDWPSMTAAFNIAHHPGDENVYYNGFVDSDPGRIEYSAYTDQDCCQTPTNLNLGSYNDDIFLDIDIDLDAERVYVSNENLGTIYYTPTFGGGITEVVNTGQVGAMTLDVDNNKIYWANNATNQILSSDLLGGGITTEISSGLGGIKAIEVSPVTGDLFILDGSSIRKYDVSTSTLSTVLNALNNPSDISVTSCIIPTIQASALSGNATSSTSVHLTWTNGNGDEVIIVAKEGSAVDVNPESGNIYSAASVFGDGDNLGSNNFVVYRGTADNVTITGLSPGTDYHFAAYSYNLFGGCYRAFSAAVTTVSTPCVTPGTQVQNLNLTGVTSGVSNLTWTPGDGTTTIVLAKNGSPVDAIPVNGDSYTSDNIFGDGDEIGTGNYVVYVGTASTVGVENLPDGVTHYAAFTFNSADFCYLTNSPATFQGPNYNASITNGLTAIAPLTATSTDVTVFTFDIQNNAGNLLMTRMEFTPGGLNAITNWTDLVENAWLEDDGGNTHTITDGGSINAQAISFSNLNIAPGAIGNIAAADTRNYELHLAFKTALTGGLATTVDNELIEFVTGDANITLSANTTAAFSQSSGMQSVSSGSNTIEVLASQINILQQPSTSVDQLEVLPQQPVFESTDANGNRDLDFNESFVVGTADPDDLSPTSSPTAFNSGLADFSGSGFNFEQSGTSTMHVLSSPSSLLSSNTDVITVTEIPPTIAITDLDIIANTNCVNNNGSVEVISITPGLISDHTFRLEDDTSTPVGGDGPLYNDLEPGDYTIFATNNNNSLTSTGLNFTISDNSANPVITPMTSPNTSCVAGNGSITLDIDGGAAVSDYNYEWFDGIGTGTPLTMGTINQNQVNDLPTGSYTVRVTNNATGCFDEQSITVGETISIPVGPGGVANNTCVGEAAAAFFEVTVPATVSAVNWFDGDPGSGGNPIANSISTTSNQLPASDFPGDITNPGTLTVFAAYIDGATGCESNASSTTLTINENPSAVISVTSDFSGFGVSCNGANNGEISVNVSGASGPFTVNLNGGTNESFINITTTAVFTNQPAGDYTVTVTDDNSCSSISNMVTITEPAPIITSIDVISDFNGAQVSCIDASDGRISVNITSGGAAPFLFELDEVPSNTSGQTSGVFDGLPVGSYTVLVTDNNSCQVSTATVSVQAPVEITAAPVVAQNISCAGNADGSLNVNASGGTGTLSYLLLEDPTNTTGSTNGIFSGLSNGSYTVEITDQNGCSVTTSAVDVNDPPAYSATLSGNGTVCSGETVSLSIAITGGTGPYSVNIENLGIVEVTTATIGVTPTSTIAYTLLGVTDVNGCPASTISGSASFIVEQNPTTAEAGQDQEICNDNVQLQANTPTIGIGNWTLISGSGLIEDPSSPTTVLSQITEGVSVLRWTISNGSCAPSTSDVAITRLAVPSGAGTITSLSGENEFCQQTTNITLNVSGILNTTSYLWTLLDGSEVTTDEASVTFDLDGTAQSGAITVLGENICGRGVRSAAFNISVIEAPLVSISTSDRLITNLPVDFSYDPAGTLNNVRWNFGDGNTSNEESPQHTYVEAGSYTVSLLGISDTGCDVQAENTITILPADPISIKNAITPNGDGANDNLIIENIELYPSNTVTFFDRWGVEVARFEGYNNEWNLTVEGDIIPAGNYICVVELPEIDEIVKRTITVVRSSN